jgi:Zn finger protein HypA/HybF involved in hydrogenase expression
MPDNPKIEIKPIRYEWTCPDCGAINLEEQCLKHVLCMKCYHDFFTIRPKAFSQGLFLVWR